MKRLRNAIEYKLESTVFTIRLRPPELFRWLAPINIVNDIDALRHRV